MSSGNSLASYLKPECIVAMTRAIQKYGRYPIETRLITTVGHNRICFHMGGVVV